MTSDEQLNIKPGSSRSTCVRFSEDEYIKVKRMQLESGRSIPWLLRTALLSGGISPPTLDSETRQVVRRVIGNMGNNINQLAKAVNSGLINDFNNRLQGIYDEVMTFKSYLGLSYGNSKNSIRQ
jgi:hypothetical protein